MIYYAIAILFGLIMDNFIGMIFPIDFSYTHYGFASCCGFIFMILIGKRLNRNQAMLIALCMGVYYDFFVTHTFFVYSFIYLFIAYIIHWWSTHITDTLVENVMLAISTLFVKEVLLYFFMYSMNITFMDIDVWMAKRLFLTLVMNGMFATIIFLLLRYVDKFLVNLEQVKRKGERISWLK